MSAEDLQVSIGLKFKDPTLLELALTHTSYVHERKLSLEKSNERLEFLGDAVLGVCIAEILIHAFPDEPEGALSKRRAALVNQKQLARLAETLKLGEALRLGKGEDKTGGRQKASLLADAFEAVVGALYLDQGLIVVQKYLDRIFAELIPVSKKVETSQDYKTRLQEYYQKKFQKSPRYVLVKESGPDHLKTFEVRIEFAGENIATGSGKSKREAEQDAAKDAFAKIPQTDLSLKKKSKRVKKLKKRLDAQAQDGDRELPKSKGIS
ncbi:MAG: rnc [Bacteriovoracaceae bacterium]|nr:rnc [Bacteriovoracaceae bacterium]